MVKEKDGRTNRFCVPLDWASEVNARLPSLGVSVGKNSPCGIVGSSPIAALLVVIWKASPPFAEIAHRWNRDV